MGCEWDYMVNQYDYDDKIPLYRYRKIEMEPFFIGVRSQWKLTRTTHAKWAC